MNKKYNLWSFIAIVIAMLSFTTFTSCKDDEDIDENGWIKIYPESENYDKFSVTNISGEIKFNKDINKYEFIPDNSKDIREQDLVWGDCGGQRMIVVITNKEKDFKEKIGKVIISGTVQFQYKKIPNNDNVFGVSDFYYSLNITSINIESLSNHTRSTNEKIKYICGTIEPDSPTWIQSRATNSTISYDEYKFNIYVHIVRSSKGEGFSSSVASTLLDNLNKYYAGSNISFSLLGNDFINDDKYNLMSYYDTRKKNANGLFTINSHSNAIDIYIISNGQNLSFEKNGITYILNGKAADIPATALLLRNNCYNTNTLAHEVGHCLGLFHTHHGTDQNEGGSPELVNGSNSATAGDFITDTPADPNQWDGLGNYTGKDLTDANGDRYNPDPYNLMSYSGHYFQNKITPKQCERIYNSIATNRILQLACKTSSTNIIGPDIIKESATYSINVSDEYDVTWNITIETFTSKTASTITYLTASGKSFVLKNPNVNATSQRYTIIANIKNKKGVTFKESKTAYYVIPSATTGTFKWSSELSGYPSYNKMGFLDPGKGDSYNTVSVFQNGDLYFYYTDVCGVNTYNNSYFNFVLNDNYSNFTKYTGGYHAYKCSRNAGTGSYTAILQVMAGSYSKLIPLNMQILQHPNPNGYDEEPKDSLEILKAKKISKYIKRI